MIDRLKLKTKIALLVMAALIGLVGMVVFSSVEMKRDLLSGRREVIQSMLEGVHATLSHLQAQEAAGTLTREQGAEGCS